MEITRWEIPKSDWLYSLQPDIKKKKKKESRETTKLFRYDLNQILYDQTTEVTNRFKELDLINRVPEEL